MTNTTTAARVFAASRSRLACEFEQNRPDAAHVLHLVDLPHAVAHRLRPRAVTKQLLVYLSPGDDRTQVGVYDLKGNLWSSVLVDPLVDGDQHGYGGERAALEQALRPHLRDVELEYPFVTGWQRPRRQSMHTVTCTRTVQLKVGDSFAYTIPMAFNPGIERPDLPHWETVTRAVAWVVKSPHGSGMKVVLATPQGLVLNRPDGSEPAIFHGDVLNDDLLSLDMQDHLQAELNRLTPRHMVVASRLP